MNTAADAAPPAAWYTRYGAAESNRASTAAASAWNTERAGRTQQRSPPASHLAERKEAVARREEAVARREEVVARREEAAFERERAAARREDAAERRETDLRERRVQIRQREDALLRQEQCAAGRPPVSFLAGAREGTREGTRKGHTTNPLDDIPKLFEAYGASGGAVPLGVVVAEVEALQQAATRLESAAASCDAQLSQLAEREKVELTSPRRKKLGERQQQLRAKKELARSCARQIHGRYAQRRDAGIARFVPLLLQTVAKYNAAFDGHVDGAGEAALVRIARLCTARAPGAAFSFPLHCVLRNLLLGFF